MVSDSCRCSEWPWPSRREHPNQRPDHGSTPRLCLDFVVDRLYHVCQGKHCMYSSSAEALAFVANLPHSLDSGTVFVLHGEPHLSEPPLQPNCVHMEPGSSSDCHVREAKYGANEHVHPFWDSDCYRLHTRYYTTLFHMEVRPSTSRYHRTLVPTRHRDLRYRIQHRQDASNKLGTPNKQLPLQHHRRHAMGAPRTASRYHRRMHTVS